MKHVETMRTMNSEMDKKMNTLGSYNRCSTQSL